MTWESTTLALAAYAAFAALGLVLPGIALQRLAGIRPDKATVLPLGFATVAALQWLSLMVGAWVFPTGLALCGICLFARGWTGWSDGPALRGALAPFAAIVALLAVTQYPANRILDRPGDPVHGSFLLDNLVPFDTAFHVGLSRELVVGYPPQVPGLSGFPLGYHLGLDLVRAAALSWARVDPWDSISRFDVTVLALALVLAVRSVAWRLGASARAIAIVPWTLLATDLSWVFWKEPSAHWWCDLLRGNLLISLVLANPVVPAMAMLLAALLCLARYERGEGRGHLALAACFAFAVPHFKVFLGAHLLLGLGVAGLVSLVRRKSPWPAAALALPCAAATAALALGQGGETVVVRWAPFDLAAITRVTLDRPPLEGASFFAWAAVWITASLAVRLVGLPLASRSLLGSGLHTVLAAVALSGWPLGLAFRASAPLALPGQAVVNDAAFLVEQAGPILWIFTVLTLDALAGSDRRRAWAVYVAAALLALPSTLQFAIHKATLAPDPIPASTVRAMRDLAKKACPGDIVMQRPAARYPPAPVVFAGLRVPYERFTPYLTQFASTPDLEARHELVYRFFRTTDRAEALAAARSLGARFIALYGADRVRFDTGGLLEPIHEEPGARVYRLITDGEPLDRCGARQAR